MISIQAIEQAVQELAEFVEFDEAVWDAQMNCGEGIIHRHLIIR